MIKGRLVFPLLSPENWGERKKEKEEKSFGRSEHTHTQQPGQTFSNRRVAKSVDLRLWTTKNFPVGLFRCS